MVSAELGVVLAVAGRSARAELGVRSYKKAIFPYSLIYLISPLLTILVS
ncbi:MAG: hypothetical protein V7L12_29835 [Nostoc sp.]